MRISLTVAVATIEFATAVEYAAEIKSDLVVKMRILGNLFLPCTTDEATESLQSSNFPSFILPPRSF